MINVLYNDNIIKIMFHIIFLFESGFITLIYLCIILIT